MAMLNNQMVSNKWYLQFFSNPPGSPVAPGLRLVKGTLDRPEARPVALISRWCCHGIHPVVQLSLKMSEKWVDLGNGDYDWSTHNGDYDWLWLMADNLPGFLGNGGLPVCSGSRGCQRSSVRQSLDGCRLGIWGRNGTMASWLPFAHGSTELSPIYTLSQSNKEVGLQSPFTSISYSYI